MAIDFNSAAPMKSTQEMYKNINQTLFVSNSLGQEFYNKYVMCI